jgi:hypothetical protein
MSSNWSNACLPLGLCIGMVQNLSEAARQRDSCPLCRQALYEPEPLFVPEIGAYSPTIHSPGEAEGRQLVASLRVDIPLVEPGSFSDSEDSVPSTPSTMSGFRINYMILPRFTPTLPFTLQYRLHMGMGNHHGDSALCRLDTGLHRLRLAQPHLGFLSHALGQRLQSRQVRQTVTAMSTTSTSS